MASVEFLEKRIAGKQAEIDKLNKKLQRIRKAEASGWEENNPYMYTPHDIDATLKEIDRAEAGLRQYQEQLDEENVKSQSRNVPAITEFLDKWEARCLEFYKDAFMRYKLAYEEYKQQYSELKSNLNAAKFQSPEYKELYKELRNLDHEFRNDWNYVTQFGAYSIDKYMEAVAKAIAQEKIRKYDFIIERVCKIVGQITDASELSVGQKGELNGIIYGTDGKAKVKTIGAGGYNIQCYHFRTIITPVR